MKINDPLLNLTEIARGMAACRSNARELLEESNTLSSGRHFSRAYALLYTACEELAKFSILELGGKRLAQGNPPVWKRFWQRFRSHESKIAQLNVQLIYLMVEGAEVVDPNIVDIVETLSNCALLIRNSALYVDAGPDGNFRKPSDIDFSIPLPALRSAAKLALSAADRRGHSTHEIELSLRKAPTQSERQNLIMITFTILQRIKDAGWKKDAMLKMLEKVLGK